VSVRNAGGAAYRRLEAPERSLPGIGKTSKGSKPQGRQLRAGRDPDPRWRRSDQTPEGSARSGVGAPEEDIFRAADGVQTSKASRKVKVKEGAENP
jgi:hypothetical protein